MRIQCALPKWIDVPHYRFEAELLGNDEFGTWIGCHPPTPYTGPKGAGEFLHAFVTLVPRDEWWLMSFNDASSEIELYVDITFIRLSSSCVLHPFEFPDSDQTKPGEMFERGRLDHMAVNASSAEAFEEIRKRLIETRHPDD